VYAEGAPGALPPVVSMLDNNTHNRTEKEITPIFEKPLQRKIKRKRGVIISF